MDKKISTASRMLNSELIAKLSAESVLALSAPVQELLLQSKSEQTFSGLLSSHLNAHAPLALSKQQDPHSATVLLEFKGVDYKKKTAKGVKKSRNFHDLAIVNQDGRIEVIIENKFWYHFDGSKGKKSPKPEKGIKTQIDGDIFKIKQTLGTDREGRKAFLLLNIVTPGEFTSLPTSYKDDHNTLFKRTSGNLDVYRSEGFIGVMEVAQKFEHVADDIFHLPTQKFSSGGFIDFICLQINL